MAHEPFVLVPMVTQLASLLIADNLAQVPIPGSDTYTIVGISASCRALTSGPATVIVKNAAGGTITTITLSAGAMAAGTLSITTIAGGDKMRMGMTAVGIGLADVTVTAWVRMPSVA